ncbi:MAG TPA: cationic amino acid transporter [Erythrobacter sp.]|nr:cationic amino acid transporter [Erythrobacter sp.]
MSTESAPLRTMGFFGTALLPLNGMIGAGIFALPAVLITSVGNFAPWMILLGGILFLPLVLVFAWLSTHYDQSGGPVLYGKTAFGDFAGFQAGWARYASAIVTVAANTHVMVTYIATVFPFFDGPIARPLTVAAFIGFITIVNLFSLRGSIGTLGVLTAVKITPLLALVLVGLATGGADLGLVVPEFTDAESVILLTYYAFIGFESVVLPAGEMKNPKRDIPRALVSMLAAVTLLYMLVIWAYIAISPTSAGNGDALAIAAREVMGEVGALAIVIAAAFSIGANNFGGGITLPRMTYGMAEQRMLPRWFMEVSPRLGTPVNSILFYGIAGILFGLWEGFLVLALAGTLTRLLTYIISAAALPVIEHREGKIAPLHTVMAILAIVSSIWVSTHADAQSWQVFGGIFVVGTGLYFIARREDPAT